MRLSALLLSLATACEGDTPGNLNSSCKVDGTCNGPKLFCNQNGFCAAVQDNPASGCSYESQCFCKTCADKCGAAGVKSCTFSDTTVWGSKPSVCECAR